MPFGRQVEPRERGRDDFRRGRLEVEQQAQRLGQIDVRKVPKDVAVDLPVEEPGQNRLPEQRLTMFGIEIEDGAGQLPEHDLRDARVERREEGGDVAEFPAQCVAIVLDVAQVVLCQAEEHAGQRRRILREQREIDERDLLEPGGGIDADPPLVGRIQMIDGSARGHQRVTPRALVLRSTCSASRSAPRPRGPADGTPPAVRSG